VLAVGDGEFQKKCIGKMEDVSRSGRTIIFVSHNMAAVQNLCRKAILLDHGKVIEDAPVEKVIQTYQSSFSQDNNEEWIALNQSDSSISLTKVALSLNGTQPHHTLTINCELSSNAPHRDVFMAFDVSNSLGLTLFQAIPNAEPFISYSSKAQNINTVIDLPPLVPDRYKVSVWLGHHNTETMCWEKEIVGFEILNSPTKGRNFPHSSNNGFLVPSSKIVP
jgi:lipopolysaccharide transport system ATP-binding protein